MLEVLTYHQHQILRHLGGIEGWGPINPERAASDIAVLADMGLVENGPGPTSLVWRLSPLGRGLMDESRVT